MVQRDSKRSRRVQGSTEGSFGILDVSKWSRGIQWGSGGVLRDIEVFKHIVGSGGPEGFGGVQRGSEGSGGV